MSIEDINRRIFLSEKYIILRLPKECIASRISSGYIRLDRDKWQLTENETLSPSVLYPALRKFPKRHFFIRNGNVVFCADDDVCPNKTYPLAAIKRYWISGVYRLLPPQFQISPAYPEPSKDY